MIVRINQIDIAKAEADAGWPSGGRAGGLRAAWPAGMRSFELLILSQDERNQPLTDAFRQHQLRQMIPQAAFALRQPDETVVARLDGPVAERELLPAWRHLTDADGRGRYAFTAVAKADDAPSAEFACVRLAPSSRRLAGLCQDPALGLDRSVRLRLFFAPEPSVAGLLDVVEADDSRWDELLAACPLVIGTTTGLRSLHLFTRRFDVMQLKSLVMQRLIAVARGEPAIP
jgi:hypothetical protein